MNGHDIAAHIAALPAAERYQLVRHILTQLDATAGMRHHFAPGGLQIAWWARPAVEGGQVVVRFSLELIVGVALAAIVTAAVMVTMFYFGPWADPPGMDELWWLLSTAAVMLASWRWWARRRAT